MQCRASLGCTQGTFLEAWSILFYSILFYSILFLHCITWFQTQLILTMCQIRYHGHCGIIVALDSSVP